MGTGFWGPPCRQGSLWSTRRHRSKETSVARRAPQPSRTLNVRRTFEPSRVSAVCVVQAYERVVPITRRPAPRTHSAPQAEGTPQPQQVGRRQHP
jgi:hypothetical protein